MYGRIFCIGLPQLLFEAYLPQLLFEACPLRKSDLNSLDFVVNRFFMKLLQTNNIDIVKCCQSHFCFDFPSVVHDNVPENLI